MSFFFHGNKAPQRKNLDKNLLIVPQIPNYPGFDFFYYHHDQKTIFMVQVTIVTDPMKHVAKNDCNNDLKTALKCWRHAFLPPCVDMVEIWMIRNTNSFIKDQAKRKKSLNVIFFDEMTDLAGLQCIQNNDVLNKLDFRTYSEYMAPENQENE